MPPESVPTRVRCALAEEHHVRGFFAYMNTPEGKALGRRCIRMSLFPRPTIRQRLEWMGSDLKRWWKERKRG